MGNNFNAGLLYNLNHSWANWMLIFIGLGIGLGLWRKLFLRPSQVYEAERGTIKRHPWPIIIAHWTNAIGFLLALYSGASLIQVLPSSTNITTLYNLHYIGLTFMLLSLLSIITYQLIYGGHSFRISIKDVRNALLELFSYAGLIGDQGILGFKSIYWPASWRRAIEKKLSFNPHHNTGKYLPVEKVLSLFPWIILVTMLIFTGILKGLHYLIPIPEGLLYVSTLLHDLGVYIGALMLAFHAGALIIVRTNWPLLGSMFTSRVSIQYVKERHPEWFLKVAPEPLVEETPEKSIAATKLEE